ncbi:MAG: DNA-3-methyladenine glycosylase I [Alphaproteobacteria bacterium]|nr:MAG: DNA-3-methyladenine glycosylase I [Alphaproteobacteria bacterium]
MERCFGKSELYAKYHDEEWGVPVLDDRMHFEMLLLESAHAGLSWELILNKRENYRQAYQNFDPLYVANMSDDDLHHLLNDTGLVRNKLKIFHSRTNAQKFLQIQKEFGSFNNYIWKFFNFQTIHNQNKSLDDVQATSKESDIISRDLIKRGMKFVGSRIVYAYLQTAGMVNDHFIDCPVYNKLKNYNLRFS